MTGLLLFILLIIAIAAGLEAQHRQHRRLGPEAPRRASRSATLSRSR